MKKQGNDLTTSQIARQNILNNFYALKDIQNQVGLQGIIFNNEFKFIKKHVAEFFGVEERTISYYLNSNSKELTDNGYKVLEGQELKDFIVAIEKQFPNNINWSIDKRTPKLSIFNFRAFLNLAMLITRNEKAKQIRSIILDISITSINKRTGGGTRYINSRDANYMQSAMSEQKYRKVLTTAIGQYVDGISNAKYSQITDYIYKAIFKENAQEYAQILKLEDIDNIHDTMYSEILMVIASFQNGVGFAIQKEFNETSKRVSIERVKQIIDDFANNPLQIPYLEDARTKMASRDFCFRDAHHDHIAEYISPVQPNDYEKFIGEHTDGFLQDLFNNRDVMKRLKK